jgi:hypothetical protein
MGWEQPCLMHSLHVHARSLHSNSEPLPCFSSSFRILSIVTALFGSLDTEDAVVMTGHLPYVQHVPTPASAPACWEGLSPLPEVRCALTQFYSQP